MSCVLKRTVSSSQKPDVQDDSEQPKQGAQDIFHPRTINYCGSHSFIVPITLYKYSIWIFIFTEQKKKSTFKISLQCRGKSETKP